MQFPEYTKESYLAAIQMGAGVVECDVTFTKDEALVCRHSQRSVHHNRCFGVSRSGLRSVQHRSRQPTQRQAKMLRLSVTSDFTLAEFKTLKGKMDGANPKATTVEEYMNSTLLENRSLQPGGTLMTHAESAALFKEHGVKVTGAERRGRNVNGFSQEMYAQKPRMS